MSKKSRREKVTAVTAIKGKRATYVRHSINVREGDKVVERAMTQSQLAHFYRTGKLQEAKTKQTSVPNILPCVEAA